MAEKKESRFKVPLKFNLAFATGEITDAVAYQGFSFLIFTFYYAVIGIKVQHVMIIYILWSIYNAFNDPILGGFSDKTRTKKLGGGRRRPWMIVAWIPLSLIMFFLFTPFSTANTHPVWVAVYFFLIICIFDTIYTAFSLNRTSLYPEMFRTDREREEAGTGRRIFMVLGLILGMGVPTLFIPTLTESSQQNIYNYWIAGAVLGVIVFVTAFINIKWGVKEPPLEELEQKETYGVFQSIWYTLKNWKFVVFILCSLMNWYVFALFPMIMPIYSEFVLLESNSMLVVLLLLVAFVSSAPGVVFWSWVDSKVGSKVGFIISQAYWVAVLIPLFFVTNYYIALVMMALNGVGLAGSPYFIDRNISNIADEDERKTGQRREASYYGVHALVIRLSSIFAIVSVSSVLSRYGWSLFDPEVVSVDLVTGLKSLISFFPAGALVIGIVFLLIYPMNKKKVDEMQTLYKEGIEKSELKKLD
ncbi:MAG: MFS transporter [Candidatus Heimdallarchaeota archaeon]|nr:MFS transporter [Candidatus Heimdallarchaeota archaeon]MCK4770054.1 MFS transporter [Candidatus Heimdallarchaeota archaeon]